MEPLRFHKALLLGLVACAVLLSGCAELEIRTEIGTDLSGRLSFALGMPEGVQKVLASQGRDPFEAFGSMMPEWSADEKITIEREVQTRKDKVWAVQTLIIKDLAAYGREITEDNNPYLLVERRPSLFWDTYRYHWRSASLGPEEGLEPPEELKGLELSDILTARWVVVMPGKATSHNGDSYNAKTGEIVWDLNVGEQTNYDFQATSRALHPVRILLVAGGLVGIFLAAVAVVALVVVMARRWAGEEGGF